jgi:2-oxoisovalerate dehydrogenase E1 component
MATEVRTERYRGLDPKAVIAAYRNIYLSRRFDDKEIQLKRQNKIYFQINSGPRGGRNRRHGPEARLRLVNPLLRPVSILQLSLPYEIPQSVGAKDDPASAGRQMPAHWGSKRMNIISKSSCTGTQFLHAVGAAEAGWRMSQIPELAGEGTSYQRDEVAYVSGGEGQTSEGEFWEALSSASNLKLPVLFCIQDNGYAISVPVEVNTPGGSISKLVRSFRTSYHRGRRHGLPGPTTPCATRPSVAAANGPAFVHAHVIRPYSHSLSDDEANYRPKAERERDLDRDPLRRLSRLLQDEGILGAPELEKLHAEVDAEINEAADRAVAAPVPEPESAYEFVYSPDVDPASAFSTQPVYAEDASRPRWSTCSTRACATR